MKKTRHRIAMILASAILFGLCVALNVSDAFKKPKKKEKNK